MNKKRLQSAASEPGKQTAKILIDKSECGHTLPVKPEPLLSLSKRDSCAVCKNKTEKAVD